MTNEQLCVWAQQGNSDAQDALIENNLGFITGIANELYSDHGLAHGFLGITMDDLIEEGRIGLWKCIAKYDPSVGACFLTYAKPSIRNAMMDLIREQYRQTEVEEVGSDDELLKRTTLDGNSIQDDNGILSSEQSPDSYIKTPEQTVIEAETTQELHAALNAIDERERIYLQYRFGFEDGEEHTLTETAKHFRLSESRARITEKAALQNLRNAFFGNSGEDQN